MCVRQPVNVGVAIPHDLKKRLDDAARRQIKPRHNHSQGTRRASQV